MPETPAAVAERVEVATFDDWMERIGLWASLLAAAIAVVVLAGDLWALVLGHTLAGWQQSALRGGAVAGIIFGAIGTFASWYHYLRVAWGFVVRHVKPNLPAEAKGFAQDQALNLPDTADSYLRQHARELRGCRARAQPPAAVGVLAAAAVVAAVTLHISTGASGAAGPGGFAHVTSFSIPTKSFAYYGLAPDREGNLWFIGPDEHEIERLAPNGSLTTVPLSIPGTSQALTITTGPDGNIWVGENDAVTQTTSTGSFQNGAILRITPAGAVTTFPLPVSDSPVAGNGLGLGSQPTLLKVGPDGQLWYILSPESFGDLSERVEHITSDGVITRFPLPKDPDTGFTLNGDFAFGADGTLWFATALSGRRGEKIVRVSPAGAILGQYPVPGLAGTTAGIFGLTQGPDGAVWFGEDAPYSDAPGKIGRITTSGAITQNPLLDNLEVYGFAAAPLVVGPDHNLWMIVQTNTSSGAASRTRVLRITPSLAITQYALPDYPLTVEALSFAPGGILWVSGYAGPQNSQRHIVYRITI